VIVFLFSFVVTIAQPRGKNSIPFQTTSTCSTKDVLWL